MKIHLYTLGESMVGIAGECVTIDWPGLEAFLDGNEETRADYREVLAETFGKLMDERPTVIYDDECPECGRPGRLPGLGCPYVDCPDNSADAP